MQITRALLWLRALKVRRDVHVEGVVRDRQGLILILQILQGSIEIVVLVLILRLWFLT